MQYNPPFWLKNGHLQSIYPTLFRRVSHRLFERERISTPDDDFINLDWARHGYERLVILSHGYEGHSRRPYIVGMARAFVKNGWDALAWNFRSCGGEMNRHPYYYHGGETRDLKSIIEHALEMGYKKIVLAGFSLGGNKTLIYLAQNAGTLPKEIVASINFSVPCDLTSSARQLELPANRIYLNRFLKSLKAKIREKHRMFPDVISIEGCESIKTFHEFDDRYTAPLHGFKSAKEYWRRCSSRNVIGQITTPTLIVNALDDPFLAPECYPLEEVRENRTVLLECPQTGGHLGFVSFNLKSMYWSEQRALKFVEDL